MRKNLKFIFKNMEFSKNDTSILSNQFFKFKIKQ